MLGNAKAIYVENDQMNIEKDKSDGVGQIPELWRGSLVVALSHLSVREGQWTVHWGKVDGLDPPLTTSDCPDQSVLSKDLNKEKPLFFFVGCYSQSC